MQRVNPQEFQGKFSALPERRINVLQGTCRVSGEPNVILTTVLGSCIATCLYDPVARIGGMNHFLLSEPSDSTGAKDDHAQRYGVYAMEVLINEMLKAGATRPNLRAHLYGGANLHVGMKSIGSANAKFATDFLRRDGIPLAHSHIGGNDARRVDFRAASGQARCKVVNGEAIPERKVEPPSVCNSGEVELF